MSLTDVSTTRVSEPLSTIAAKTPEGPSSRDGGTELIGSTERCEFTYRIGIVTDGVYRQQWVTCGRWICRYCREQKITQDCQRYTEAFAADGRPVYLCLVETRAKATNVVRYATRLGHTALVVPQDDGTAIVFTSQPRHGGHLLSSTELADTIDMFMENVPAYTAEGGEHRLVNVNQVLREHLLDEGEFRAKQRAEMSGHEFDLDAYHRFRDDQPRRVYGNSSFDATLEFLDLVTKRDRWGRIIEARIPAAEDKLSWARAMFWHEYRQLHEVTHAHAA